MTPSRRLLYFVVLPKSKNPDDARRELIFNILVIASLLLILVVFAVQIIVRLLTLLDQTASENNALSLWMTVSEIAFLLFLYFLSRKGLFKFSAIIFLTAIFVVVLFMGYRWGVDLPIGVLAYALIIFMAGILIGSRLAFLATTVISVAIAILSYLHQAGIVEANRYWVRNTWELADVVVISAIFFIIATVSWLSNREIEKSLARARRSEADLKKERDSLEITVEARTRELKETQAEKMTQLYRFAEFGRLSSGLFHDLINPLTAVSLNIEKVKNAEEVRAHVKSIEEKTGAAPITEVSEYVDKAIVAARKMEDMVNAVRKQLSRQETKTLFSVNEEIAQALEVLSHKAQKSGVAIRLFSREPGSRSSATSYSSPSATAELSLPGREIKTYGDAVKFNQVPLNLVANAIDSYSEKRDGETRTVTMSLTQEGNTIIFEVKDKGAGISEENKPRLFEPFFTTKEGGYGLGIGLSMIKRIIEKDFGGTISVKSKDRDGSTFTVKFPQKDTELTAE